MPSPNVREGEKGRAGMRLEVKQKMRPSVSRGGLLVRMFVASLVAASSLLASTAFASGAVSGSKTTIKAPNCSPTSCLITWTMKGIVKVSPTGTVSFLIGSVPVAGSGGDPCSVEAITPYRVASATATCDAVGLAVGRNRITVSYSGDNDFNPSDVTKPIRVHAAPPS
jgi:hypothetical protein